MIKSPKSILEILRTWYAGPVPDISELTVLWEDEVIVSLRWKEIGGTVNQTKAIRSGRGWILNPKRVEA